MLRAIVSEARSAADPTQSGVMLCSWSNSLNAESFTIGPDQAGIRLDQFLVQKFPEHSRGEWQRGIEQGRITVNLMIAKPSRKLHTSDVVSVQPPDPVSLTIPAENLPIEILYEDDALIVLNKAAGMIVHPGRGRYGGTLVSALKHHFQELSDLGGADRPGIVHRLDRDTSGVIVVAKDNQAHHRLSSQFEKRTVRKEYRAIVQGRLDLDQGRIETYLRVDPYKREKMCVCPEGGNARIAITEYEVLERFPGYTLVALFPKTGRTHQLRVHMKHLGHPIAADKLYGGAVPEHLLHDQPAPPTLHPDLEKSHPQDGASHVGAAENKDQRIVHRQALHAFRIAFDHPTTGKRLQFEAPIALDIRSTIERLRRPRP